MLSGFESCMIVGLDVRAEDHLRQAMKPSIKVRTLTIHQEIGFTHMRILEGVQTLLQLSGCVARLCKINMQPQLFILPTKSK
jgi:hypothetical protein